MCFYKKVVLLGFEPRQTEPESVVLPLHNRTKYHARAKNGVRTRDPDLGKVVLCQLSYFRLSSCKYTKFEMIIYFLHEF